MKVTVKKYLNVRVGEPSVNAPCYQYLAPGSVLEVDGILYKGDLFEDSDQWLKDAAGNYYWAGGVESLKWNYDPDKMSWMHASVENGGWGIVDLWNRMEVRGENINVLVLDTGINPVGNFNNLKATKFRNSFSSVKDTDGHGTNCCSVLCGNGNIVYGVAPDINLYVLKFTANQFASIESMLSGISILDNSWNIDVVSISYCFSENLPALEAALTNKFGKNVVVVSSLNHNNIDKFIIGNDQYPAAYPNVWAITAADVYDQIVSPCKFLEKSLKPNWAFPGHNIKALGKSGKVEVVGQTSIATPIAAGFWALFLSYFRKKNIVITDKVIENLSEMFLKTSIMDHKDQASIIHCNPVKAFEEIVNSRKIV